MSGVKERAGALALALALGSCAPGMLVEKVPLADAVWTGAPEVLAPLRFEKAAVALPRGRRIGAYRDGLECTRGGENIWWNTGAVLAKDIDWNALFHEQMTIAGHTVLGDPGALFESKERDRPKPAFLVSARIEEIRLNLCDAATLLTGTPLDAQTGQGSVRVYWQVLSVLEKKVVLEASTAGYHDLTQPVGNGPVVLIMEAFAQAAANFAADPKLIALVSAPRAAPDAVLRTRVAERQWLPPTASFANGLLPNIDAIRHAVVTIDAGEGHGSGFFIAPDLILTTFDAVEGTELVRVTLTTGRSFLGSVVRWHDQRNVALVQVEKAGHHPLPLRLDPVKEAEDVYAIANPRARSQRATVTRGVVGGMGQNGFGLGEITADVGAPAGLLGGPLLDGAGSVIGIATTAPEGGLSTFAPIGDALGALNLRRRHPNDTREEAPP
ncbi:MAG: trypsin-like peptidase domain-containing protein [Rhodospirillaceae bacterium]